MPSFESVDGTKLSYDVDGDGTPVVLLHGYASDAYLNWVRPGIVEALTRKGFKTICLDQRGHGMSAKPHDPAAYEGDIMVRDAQALLDEIGFEKVLLGGFSMGGRIALELITRDARVAAAALTGVGANMLAERAHGNLIADAMLAEDKSTITNSFAKSFRDFADLTRADRQALALIQMQPRPPVERLDAIAIPVLVLGAEGDALAGPASALADVIPGATWREVPGTHLNVVNNYQFHEALVGFFEEHRGAV